MKVHIIWLEWISLNYYMSILIIYILNCYCFIPVQKNKVLEVEWSAEEKDNNINDLKYQIEVLRKKNIKINEEY